MSAWKWKNGCNHIIKRRGNIYPWSNWCFRSETFMYLFLFLTPTVLFTVEYVNNLWNILGGGQSSNNIYHIIGEECEGNLRWSFHYIQPGQTILVFPAWETGRFKTEFNSNCYWAITQCWTQKWRRHSSCF